MPAAKWQMGMFDRGGQLVGVVVLGIPMHDRVLRKPFPDLVPLVGSIELSRLCIVDGVAANAETGTARVFRHLREHTEIRAVLAFSDPQPRRAADGRSVLPGHWGLVYQAKGAVAMGRGRARVLTQLPDGTVLPDRARAKLVAGDRGWSYVAGRLVALGARPPAVRPGRAWLDQALADVGATRVRHGGCLRYGFPLDRHVRLGIAPGPYLKPDQTPDLLAT